MEINKKTLKSIFWCAAACIGLYWLLHETNRLMALLKGIGAILAPFIGGALLAFVLNVPMRAIERSLKGIHKDSIRRAVAVVLTLVLLVLIVGGVILLLVPQIIKTVESLVATLPDFFKRVYNWFMDFLNGHPEIMEWLNENTDFETMDWQALLQKAITVISSSMTTIINTAFSTVINVSNGIFNAFISIVFAIYCLFRKEILARQGRRLLYSIFPEKFSDETVRILRLSNGTFSSFISGQCVEAVILGSMFAVCMLIFRMPYVPLVSVVIAITALVPIVGAFVGCVLGAFFILVDNPVQAIWFVIMFLTLQQIENNLIYPKVVGKSIGLPGMWVLVAVTVGGDLMGIVGMLLMIPFVSVCYTLLREFTNKRLSDRNIDRYKVNDHPLESNSRLKEKIKSKKPEHSKDDAE